MRAALEAAADGLVYSSESDRPFEYVELAAAAPPHLGPLTAERLAALLGAAPGTRIEERSLDRFLARHIETSDPYDAEAQRVRPRYEALRDVLRGSLADVRVFRVGEVEVRCYVVGWTPEGSLAGLVTTAVET